MTNENQKQRIERLMKMKGIKQTDLLRKILYDVYGPSANFEKEKGNFNKMISGERDFPAKYVVPLENHLQTSLCYIKTGMGYNLDFKNKGLRYTAFLDDYDQYNELRKDGYLYNYDEFDKNILDYILESSSISGLRYLIDKKLIYSTETLKSVSGVDPIFYTNDYLSKILILLCEKDDEKYFNMFYKVYEVIWYYKKESSLLEDTDVLKAILKTKKIFASCLSDRKISLVKVNRGLVGNKKSGLFCNPLLFYLTNYALKNEGEYKEQINKMLEWGSAYNIRFEKFAKEQDLITEDLMVGNTGYVTLGITTFGNLFTFQTNSPLIEDSKTQKLLDEITHQVNSFKFQCQKLGGYSGSAVHYRDQKILKKTSNNSYEYDFLKLMTNNGYTKTPIYFGTKNGFDEFSYFEGKNIPYTKMMGMDDVYRIIDELKTINGISKAHLKNGKVFVHGDLGTQNVIFKDGEINGIIDWDGTHIGEEHEDLIYIIWVWLNIGDLNRDNELIFNSMRNIINHYNPSDDVTSNFADKMIEVMDSKLKSTSKTAEKYEKIFQWVGWSKIWVELYRDKISKEIG